MKPTVVGLSLHFIYESNVNVCLAIFPGAHRIGGGAVRTLILARSLVIAWASPQPVRGVRKTMLPLNPERGCSSPPPSVRCCRHPTGKQGALVLLLQILLVLPALGFSPQTAAGSPREPTWMPDTQSSPSNMTGNTVLTTCDPKKWDLVNTDTSE